jgi:hypothetical protein
MSDDLEPLSTDIDDTRRAIPALPPKTLRLLLRYEPDTGKLFWLPRGVTFFVPSARRTAEHKMNNWNSKCAGKEAFTAADCRGARQGRIFDRGYLAHRVIWALMTGAWPEEDIDHEDRNPGNNRWVNLRSVTHAENMRNLPPRPDNKSGVCGVSWSRRRRKWAAQIRIANKVVPLGMFDTVAEAAHVRANAEQENNFHRNHGRHIHERP